MICNYVFWQYHSETGLNGRDDNRRPHSLEAWGGSQTSAFKVRKLFTYKFEVPSTLLNQVVASHNNLIENWNKT